MLDHSLAQRDTHVNFRVNNIDETPKHDNKVEDVPRIAEVILQVNYKNWLKKVHTYESCCKIILTDIVRVCVWKRTIKDKKYCDIEIFDSHLKSKCG